MSDYLFSSFPQQQSALSVAIQSIYKNGPPDVTEYHGDWGSLAVSQGHYRGFLPYENENYLFVVIGGPVLYFRDNDFLVDDDSSTATQAIFQRWVIDGKMQWDEDLSGPFTVLLINKLDNTLRIVTDLMAFIPVYSCQQSLDLYLGTHVDALASACGDADRFDPVSLADFVLNDVVTYPYTAYQNIRQQPPGSVVSWTRKRLQAETYWQPGEGEPCPTLNEAAQVLRQGLEGYVDRVTAKMNHAAQFISAGEDSRALSGFLPSRLKRDAYIFLDQMNREGRIAQKVARVYGASFTVGYRSATHYLDILPEASRLVGSGHQYTHSHSLGFDKKYKLSGYPAVFGGFLSDTHLKGHHIKKIKGCSRFPFFPQIQCSGFSPCGARFGRLADLVEVIEDVKVRQQNRFEMVTQLRPASANEWFNFYPCSMHNDIPYLYSSRRLYRCYEPFMCKEAVKISASVPNKWKLNRILFNRAMKPFLKPGKWLPHADGRLPYFSWKLNIPIHLCSWLCLSTTRKVGFIKGNQGPWCDWKFIIHDEKWKQFIDKIVEGKNIFDKIFKKNVIYLLEIENISYSQKINILQSLYLASNRM